jgi:hypothetical protein
MGLQLSLPRKYYIGDEEVIPASQTVIACGHGCAAGMASRVPIFNFRLIENSTKPLRYYVKIQPLTVSQIASHFEKIAKSVDWPLDEADIE